MSMGTAASPELFEAELKWEPRYSVGVRRLDEEHKVMIDLINKAKDAAELMEADEVVDSLLGEMYAYSLKHFATEKELMNRYGFEYQKEHDAVHQIFVDRVTQARARKNGQRTDPFKVFQFLIDWFQSHILGDDMKLGAYLNQKGVF